MTNKLKERIKELEALLSESVGIIKSTAMELNCMIDMKNADVESEVNNQTETPPDYFDAQTVHEAMVFRKKVIDAIGN